MGRPSKYCKKVADEICRRLAEGESLIKICKDAHLPNKSVVLDWALKDPAEHPFPNQYTRARHRQAEGFIDEIMEIADNGSHDIETDEDGNEIVNREHLQRSRLRFDARRWYASKVLPKIYGDKLAIDQKSEVTHKQTESGHASTDLIDSYLQARDGKPKANGNGKNGRGTKPKKTAQNGSN